MLIKRTHKKTTKSIPVHKEFPISNTHSSLKNRHFPHAHQDSRLRRSEALEVPEIFWQKVQLLAFLLIFSAIMLCCTQNPYTPPSQQSLDQTIKDLLNDDASCSIPEPAQIIHLPQVHKYPEPLSGDLPEQVLNFFHDIAAHSQFLIVHTIKKYPSHIVFNEGSRFIVTQNTKENITYTISNNNDEEMKLNSQDVANIFDHSLPFSYNSLNMEQKNILLELGAAPIALSLDHIKVIHRTHNPSEAKLLGQILTRMWNSQKELKLESHDLYERILNAKENKDEEALKKLQEEAKELSKQRMILEDKSDQLIINRRESILSREVHFFLENNPSRKVFIIYGAAHDLSDEFSEDLFYTLPHKCTMPQSFLKSPAYANHLASWADSILTDNDILFSTHIQSMRILYKKSYKILMDTIEEHTSAGGDKEDPSTSWDPTSNRYLTYSELERIAEGVYVQMIALEDVIRSSNPMTYTTINH